MQPILILLFFILLLMLLGTILLLARENKKTNDKQQIRPRNGTAIDEMPNDLDEAMVWLEAFAQKENVRNYCLIWDGPYRTTETDTKTQQCSHFQWGMFYVSESTTKNNTKETVGDINL